MIRRPQKNMLVREMGNLLGLKKVDSYWLVHKGFFEIILVGRKMRVVIASFENWYARQAKYHKVTGEPPGELLKQKSYSARDIAGILGVSESYVYEIMKAAGIVPVMVNFRQRFRREDFEQWYCSQTRFRNGEDRRRDEEIEESSMSMPDMARLLDVSRSVVYGILQSDLGKEMLEAIIVAGRKRITRESFDRWYASQTRYLKPEDQPEGVPRRHKSYADTLVNKKVKADSGLREIRYSSNPDYLTIDEAAYVAKVSMDRIYRWIQSGKIPALKLSKRVTRIPRTEFESFLEEYMKQDKE